MAALTLLLTLLTLTSGICVAQTISPGVIRMASPVTQRRINDWAAALEQARYSLVEEPSFRQPNETLPVYLRRLVQPLSAETPAQYAVRIDRYLAAFQQASAATQTAQRMPLLRDNGAANQKVWQRAVRSITLLPERIRKMQIVWTRVRKLILQTASLRTVSARQNKHLFSDSVNSAAMASELEQTLGVVLEARSALRDARP